MIHTFALRIERRISALPACWSFSAAAWLTARVLLLLWGALIWKLALQNVTLADPHYYSAPVVNDGLSGALVGVWQRWDTIYYQLIAQFGYAQSEWSAFFPLLPILAAALSKLTGLSALVSILIVANTSCYFALVLLYRLADEHFGPASARFSVLAALVLPTSFYLFSGYPLSLALCLTLLAYESARRQRWPVACAAAMLAGLAHGSVIPLVALLAWQVRRAYLPPWSARRLVLGLLPITPLLGTGLFLAYRAWLGLPGFSELQAQAWQRIVQPPWVTLANMAAALQQSPLALCLWVDSLFFLLMAACVVLAWKRIDLGEWLYFAVFFAFLLMTSVKAQPLESLGRLALLGFPMYLLFGQLAGQKKAARLAFFALGVALQAFISAVFFMWGWVD